MSILRLILLILFLVLYPSLVQSQPQYEFECISIEQGLSQTSVNDIFQDHQGFLWFATQDGLNRYDGYNLKIYKNRPFDNTTLPHNWITTLTEDADGNLWIGMESGLGIYNRNTDSFSPFRYKMDTQPVFNNIRVTRILIDLKGLIWIGTQYHGLYQYNPHSNTLHHFFANASDPAGLSGNSITSIFQDSNQRLWIGTSTGLNRYNSSDSSFTCYLHSDYDPLSIADNDIMTITEGPANHLWIGTSTGLCRFYPERGKFENNLLKIADTSSISLYIQCFLYDQDGFLWIGSAEGLHLYNISSKKHYTYLNKPENVTSISDNNIYSLYQDRSGLIWIGTLRRGINKLNKLKSFFHNIHKNPFSSPGLNNDFVYAFQHDTDSILWVGTDGGLNRYNRITGEFSYYKQPGDAPNTTFVRSLLRDREGNLWIGTRGGGLVTWISGYSKSIRSKHFMSSSTDPNSISSDFIYRMIEDQDGILWFATWNGLCALEPQHKYTGRFKVYKNIPEDSTSLPVNKVPALYESRDGALWVGTYGGGLCRYDKTTRKFHVYRHDPENKYSLSNDYIYSILEDSQGTLWVGTYGGGLNALSISGRENGIFRHYFTEHGLPSNLIYGIIEDNSHQLWVSTTRGLASCDINQAGKETTRDELIFRRYDATDGVQSTEFNFGAYYQNATGELFFGGINGFTFFNPDDIKQNSFIPPVMITDFKIFNQSIPLIPDINGNQNKPGTGEMKLAYSQNVITIEFAALDFYAPQKNLYLYKMEDFDSDWMLLPTGHHSVTYTNLDPGTYTFMVKGSNSDGIWNDQETTLKLIITPPFWMSWWFRSLVVFFMVALLFTIYWTRMENMKKQKIELEKQVNQRTQELRHKTDQLEATNFELESFAYSVSHDLRTPLRSLSGFSNLAMEEITDYSKPLLKSYLQRIQNSAHQMSDLIDALLTLSRLTRGGIHRSVLNISVMVQSILTELQRSAPTRYVEFQIEPDIQIQGDEALVKALLENLLGNAWKFSEHREVTRITFGRDMNHAAKGKATVLYIQDNGAGFDMEFYDKLFKPFQRLHSQNEFTGTGVGLATVKRIINRHGGQIWAEGRVDKGTTFYFTLSG